MTDQNQDKSLALNTQNPLELMATADIQVGLADVVSVRSAKIEGAIRDKMKEITRSIRDLKKEESDATDESRAAIKAQIKAELGEEAQSCEDFMNRFDSCQLKMDGASKKDHDSGDITLVIALRSGWWSYQKNLTVEASERVIAAHNAVEAIEAKLVEAQELHSDYMRKLKNVEIEEKKIRAQVIEAQLSTTEDGKRLVANLLIGIDDAVDAL